MTVTAKRASRLVALTRVDMVGSTAALAGDGVTAAVGDRRQLAEIVGRAAARAGGSVVVIEGDAAVIACPSTAGALAVAGEVCAEARSERFEVRVGVTIGELAGERAADLPALDEPLTARLEAIERASGPGEVTIDGLTRRVLAGTTGMGTEAVADTADTADPCHRVTRFPSADDEAGPPTIPSELRAVVFSRFALTDPGHDVAPNRNPGSVIDGASTDGGSGGLASVLEGAAGLIAARGGTVVDANGPGHVAVFASGREALIAAEAIHGLVAAASLEAGAGPPIAASMSMAIGEVTVGGHDNYGRPVVEAARLLDHAANGTALTTDGATIIGLDQDGVETLGSIPLKGFDEAPTVHRIRPAGPPRLVELPPTLRRPGRFAFAGRSDELASLETTWRSVCDGVVAGVVVSGEEGAGKTRLTSELAIGVAAAGGIVLFGAADEELAIPYATIAQALSAAAPIDTTLAAAMAASPAAGRAVDDRGTGGPGADGVSGPSVGALRALFAPAGATVIGGPGLEAGGAPVERHDLFADVSACIGRLSRQRPVLLIIDDLQWAGADTIELIDHLLADPAGERVMVLATVRSEHLGPGNPVDRLIGSSRHTRPLTHHRLDRLDQVDVAAMLVSRAGAALTGGDLDFVAEVTRATGGSPLFVEELVVYLAAIGVLQQQDGRWELAVATDQIPIPETILDLMARRLARLGSPADEILPVAAIAGPTFTVDLVAGVLDQPIEAIVDVVDRGVDIGLLHDDGPAGSFSFADEITREAALRPLRPARRALLHRSIADYLEGYRPQPIDALAHHWELAIGRDAVEHTVRYQRMAAARDIAAAAWESAIERLRRVTGHLDSLGSDDDRVRAEVHYDLGYSLRMIGDDSHLPDLAKAADLARRLGDGPLLASAAMAMMRPGAWYPEAAVVDDQISEMYQDALYLLSPDDPTRPRVLAALATNLAYDPDGERRWMLLREAQQAAEELGDRQLMAITAAAELIACQEPDLFERRWTLACEVRRAGQATGDRDLAFTGGFFMMLEHIGRGQMDEATGLAAELGRLAEASRSYWPRFLMAHFGSLTAIARCSPDALEVIEAERLAFEDQPVDWFGVSVIQQAVVAMGRGTLAEMLVPFAEAQAQYRENDEWSRKWNYAVAKAYLDSGRLEEAAEVIANSPDLDFDRYWLSSMLHLGQVGLVLGRAEYCERVLAELDRYRGRFAFIGVGAAITGQVSTGLGQAALGLGRLDQAEELFREAVAQAEAVQFPFFETIARRHLAMTLVARDPADGEAVDHLDAAAAMAERHGFALEAAAIESVRADVGR